MAGNAAQDEFVTGWLGVPLGGAAPGGAPGGAVPAAVMAKPVITVKNVGDGSFVITGQGFLPNAPVVARVTGINSNGIAQEYGGYQSDGGGGVSITTVVLVNFPVVLYFEVSDKRPDPNDASKELWTDPAIVAFQPGQGDPPDPDPEPAPAPDPGADPGADPGTDPGSDG